jgi:hypothetical protein
MSLINPVQYQIFNQVVPAGKLPIIEINSLDMAYGTITLQLPIPAISSITPHVFIVVPPTSEQSWVRVSVDLYPLYPTCLTYSYLTLNSGEQQITWNFDPTQVLATTGQTFSYDFIWALVRRPQMVLPFQELGTGQTRRRHMLVLLWNHIHLACPR